MSKATVVVFIGIIVALISFMGFPSVVKVTVTVLAGIAIIILGLLMRVERLWLLRALQGGHKTDAYAENGAPNAGE